jgi:pimeloyl-ACP methyl ester carboxylesterase
MHTVSIAAIWLFALALVGVALWTPDRSFESLLAKYVGAADEFKAIAGIRLFLRDTGNRAGLPISLLHGFASSLQTWDGWSAGLGARYRVICMDLPGFGLTGAEPAGDYSDDRGLAILLALMPELGIGRAILVGHSLGARIAWQFAARLPARVEKLVLVAPNESIVRRYRNMLLAPGVRGALVIRMAQIALHDPVTTLQRIQAPT